MAVHAVFGSILLMRSRRPQLGIKSSVAVEFAMVGIAYFTLLFLVIQGGIFYVRVTMLDMATEQVARLIMVNNNASTSSPPPATAAAFAEDIQAKGYGLLQQGNITVTLEECAPQASTVTMSGTPVGCTGGFAAMSVNNFGTADSTYQYYPGSCTVAYTIAPAPQPGATTTSTGTTQTSHPSFTLSNVSEIHCTGACTTFTGTNLVNGSLFPAPDSVSSATTYTSSTNPNASYICGSGQDVVLKVQYKDPATVGYLARFFGTATSTLAFQIEPAVL